MKKRIILIGTIFTAVLALGLAGCGTTETGGVSDKTADVNNTVNIAYVGSGINFPTDLFGIALDQGFLDEELQAIGWNYEVTSFTGGNLVNEALISGDADIGMLGDVPAATSKSKGADTTLIAYELHSNDAALVTAPNSDIESITDLKGKTVATLESSFMHKVLFSMLEANGMSIDDIQFVNMPSVDAATAVEIGSVDAALLSETQYAIEAVDNKVKVLLSGSDNSQWRGSSTVVASNKFLEKNRDVAVALLKAYERANQFALENYDAAIASIAKSGISEAAIKFRFPETVDFDLRADEEVIKDLNTVFQFLKDADISSGEVDVNAWLDSSVLEDAKTALDE